MSQKTSDFERPWICTFSGKQHYITDPDTSSIDIETIAHALSLICRFGGHVSQFYSVGEHSVRVSRWLQKKYPKLPDLHLYGLLHDGSEAYLNDVVSPLKITMPGYRDLEARTEKVVYEALGIDPPGIVQNVIVKTADMTFLATERRDLLPHGEKHEWSQMTEPADEDTIYPWPSNRAEKEFLFEYRQLKSAYDQRLL